MVREGPLGHLSPSRVGELIRLPTTTIAAITRDRPSHYRERPLVTGGGKTRLLHVPHRELKLAQKRLLQRVLGKLPPHDCTACVRKRGTHWAYDRHAGHPAILRLDLADFFPSVPEGSVTEGFARLGAGERMAALLTGLTTLETELPQGAPTSVAVADIVLYPLDVRLGGLARKEGLTYTRYVDDLTISGGERRIERNERLVRKIVSEEGWALNEKGGIVGPEARHDLLGAVVNQKPNVSREYFGSVRSYLRLVGAGKTRIGKGDFETLSAKVNWIRSVNPERMRVLQPLLEEAARAMTHQPEEAT